MTSPKREFDFGIGADPEFILTMQGRKVDAQQTMKLMLDKKKGFVPNDMGYTVKPFGAIGWDGASSTAEVRPDAAHTPTKVINNLAGLLKATTEHIRICDMSTISEFSSIGGHIHLEVPKGEEWSKEKENIIHKRLSSFYLPILISENKTNLNLRLRQGYGSLKDHRVEKHFEYPDGTSGYTFEFRCPSAEWMTTPKIAEATLAYMAVVYHEILNHPKNFSKFNDIIYKSDKQGDALQSLAIMEFEILTTSILNRVKKYIRSFEMYKEYKEEIEYILNAKQVIKDKQKAGYDIVTGWNLITKGRIPTKTEVLSSKKTIQSIAEKTDFDILKQVMNIHYNNDTNVALFAETFKDRVAAFNWKLKNNYFIFGMRKAMPIIMAKNFKGDYLTGKEVIKTTSDLSEVNNLFDKMTRKFMNGNDINMEAGQTIDFTTGKPKDTRNSMIIIGIPYDMRIQENVKPFLSFIWSLEKGEVETVNPKNEPQLIEDDGEPIEKRGELYKILTKQTETPQEVILDSNSNSLRRHLETVEAIRYEDANATSN